MQVYRQGERKEISQWAVSILSTNQQQNLLDIMWFEVFHVIIV